MQVRNILDPLLHGLRVLLRFVDGLNRNCLGRRLLHNGSKGQIQNRGVTLLRRRFVKAAQPQRAPICNRVRLCLVRFDSTGRLRYLDEGVDVSDSWDVVRDERLKAVIEFDGLRSVPQDVLEQAFYLPANW